MSKTNNDYAVDPEDYAPAQGSDERFLWEKIHLGVEAKQFMESKLATYICEAAEVNYNKARNELEDVDPRNWEKIQQLQIEVHKFKFFINKIAEMVAAGDSAYQMYLHQHLQD